MTEKIAIVVVKLVREAAEQSNEEIEMEICEAVESVMTGYLPYEQEVLKVTVLEAPI